MAKKKNKAPTAEPERYSKKALLRSKRFYRITGLLDVLLTDNQFYTIDEVNELVEKTMKGKVD